MELKNKVLVGKILLCSFLSCTFGYYVGSCVVNPLIPAPSLKHLLFRMVLGLPLVWLFTVVLVHAVFGWRIKRGQSLPR